MLNGLDLFSGIAGLTIALAPWVQPAAYCESDRYATAVLLSRMASGDIPTAPIWDDVRTLKGNMLPEIDIIYGGFPCQDVSTAGLRKGLDGERTGLFREAIRLVSECRPQFVFLENVPGIRKYVPTVRSELEAIGYDCRDGFLSASDVGARHLRNRWWLLAYANSYRCGELHKDEPQRKQKCKSKADTINDGAQEFMADTQSKRGQRLSDPRGNEISNATGSGQELAHSNDERQRIGRTKQTGRLEPLFKTSWWSTEPDVGRVANGIPFRVDRLRGLGNAVVPAQAREAFKRLSGLV